MDHCIVVHPSYVSPSLFTKTDVFVVVLLVVDEVNALVVEKVRGSLFVVDVNEVVEVAEEDIEGMFRYPLIQLSI